MLAALLRTSCCARILTACCVPLRPQGGCEDAHARMDYMHEEDFKVAHGEDK